MKRGPETYRRWAKKLRVLAAAALRRAERYEDIAYNLAVKNKNRKS